MKASVFIVDGMLPDIKYLTVPPEETVCPRVIARDGEHWVYIYKERDAAHKGFVQVEVFLHRLAQREPGLMVTGYRKNGRQTTLSFNKWERVTLSPRITAYLAQLGLDKLLPSLATPSLTSSHQTTQTKTVKPSAAPAEPKTLLKTSPKTADISDLFTNEAIRFGDHCCQADGKMLPQGRFTLDDLTIATDGPRRLRFAPLGNQPVAPKIALVGITPGGQVEKFARYLRNEPVRQAAQRAAFNGAQTEIKELLDAHGFARHVGLSLDGDINDSPDILTTSLVKCCLMVDEGYRFEAPDIAACLPARHCATTRFISDISRFPSLRWVVVFGKPGWEALHALDLEGISLIDLLRTKGLVVLQFPHFAQNFQQRALFMRDEADVQQLLADKPDYNKYAAMAAAMRRAVLEEVKPR